MILNVNNINPTITQYFPNLFPVGGYKIDPMTISKELILIEKIKERKIDAKSKKNAELIITISIQAF